MLLRGLLNESLLLFYVIPLMGFRMEAESDKNKLRLDYRENPDLLAALGSKEPGDSGTLTINYTTLNNDPDDGIELTIDSLVLDEEEVVDGEDPTAFPTGGEPVMAVMIGRNDSETEED